MRPLLATFIQAFLLSSCLLRAGDEPRFFPEKTGEWKYSSNHDNGDRFGLSPEQNRRFMAKVDAIASLWRQTKVFNPPLGFEARSRGEYFVVNCDGASCHGKPARARLSTIFYYFVEDAKGQPSWGGEVNTSAELCINDPFHVLSSKYSLWSGGLWLPDGREISLEPRQTGQVAGFPIYNADLLVFTRKAAPNIQLISILFYFEDLSPRNIGHQKLQEFLTTADWQHIENFIDDPRP